jgi:hypothetical protein
VIEYLKFSEIIEANGRTVRENNMQIGHTIPIGAVVELKYDEWCTGGLSRKIEARMTVVEHRRDCDGTPLYGLAFCTLETYLFWRDDPTYKLPSTLIVGPTGYAGGFSAEGLKVIEVTPELIRGDNALEWADEEKFSV